MTLSDWLAENPHGPYEVGIFTVMPDEDPADLTAGRLVMTVSDVLVEGDAIIFYQNNSDSQECNGEVLFVESSFTDATVTENGEWCAEYRNLRCAVEGFYEYPVIVVRKAFWG